LIWCGGVVFGIEEMRVKGEKLVGTVGNFLEYAYLSIILIGHADAFCESAVRK